MALPKVAHKFLFFTSVALMTSLSPSAFTQTMPLGLYSPWEYENGATNYQNQTLPNLKVNGKTTIKDVNVHGDTLINGFFQASNSKLNRLSVNGRTSIDETTVSGKASINGFFQASESRFYHLSVSGRSSISKTIVSGKTSIAGFCEADQSTFENTCVIAGRLKGKESTFTSPLIVDLSEGNKYKKRPCNATILQDCLTKDITIILSKQNPKETLKLLGETHVNGSIEFKEGDGICVVSDKATITGKVIGAKIIRESEYQRESSST